MKPAFMFIELRLFAQSKQLLMINCYINLTIMQDAYVNMYNLGVHLREIYNKFLGETYMTEIMKMRTSEHTLSILSAQLVNAGLWPPSEEQIWMEDFNWQPIPIGRYR